MVPTIDIAPLFGGPSIARARVDSEILRAAGDTGFMTVAGLPGDSLSAVTRKRLLAVFALSDAKKRTMCRRSFVAENGNLYRGWFPLQAGHQTYKEGPDLGPDLVGPTGHDPRDPLTEPTPLPAENDLPGWRAVAAAYYRDMECAGA